MISGNDRRSWWVFWSFLYVFRRLRTKLPVHFLDQSLLNAGEVSEPDLSWGLASKTELWIFSGHLYNTNSGIGTDFTEADISLFALFANQSAVQKSQLAMTRNRDFVDLFFAEFHMKSVWTLQISPMIMPSLSKVVRKGHGCSLDVRWYDDHLRAMPKWRDVSLVKFSELLYYVIFQYISAIYIHIIII